MIADPAQEPELLYDLRVLPAGRVPFRRVRWELWHGQRLLATGWRTTESHAHRALSTAASRFAHRVFGLTPLRPEATTATGRFGRDGAVRLDCGAVSCRLVPRSLAPGR